MTLAVLPCLLFVAFLTAAPRALALQTHVFSSSFGSSGSGDGQVSLASNSGIAVNNTTHDVYVADTGNARIDEFDSSGTFFRAWGWGVADGLPAFETCTLICQQGLAGSGPGQFTAPTFIAVDNSAGASTGDVYVADTANNVVTKFAASGGLITTWGDGGGATCGAANGQLSGACVTTPVGGPFGPLAGVAVDGAGTLDVFDTNTNMFEFAQDGTFTTDFTTARGTAASGLAVDGSGNFFKVNAFPSIEQFRGDGTDVGQVTASQSATGVVADSSNGDLYVDTGGAIDHYAFDGSGNVLERGSAACPVAPNAGCAPTDSFGSGHLSVAAGLGVDPSNHDLYAADGGNARIGVFTPVTLVDVITNAASNVAATTATLNGHLDPAGGGDVTGCQFEYVDDATFQATGFSAASTASCAEGNSFSAPADVHADVSGLSAETTYHVRLTATNSQGTNAAGDSPFSTAQAVQEVTTGAASNITDVTATLNGTVNAGGTSITDCHFEYVTDAAFQATGYTDLSSGGSKPCNTTPVGTSPTAVQADVTGLTAVTAYHFRLLATNVNGTTAGQDQTFTTNHVPIPPAIDSTSASNVTADAADLHAQINPNFYDTHYHFEYVDDTAFQASGFASASKAPVPDGGLEPLGTGQPAPAHIAGLALATTYHYRVIADNGNGGPQTGPTHTFTTPGAGGPFVLPDNRAYEQVSPIYKNGGDATTPGITELNRAAASGDAIAFASYTPFAGVRGDYLYNQYISRRSPSGWSTVSIDPPKSALSNTGPGGGGGGFAIYPWLAFSPELTQGVAYQSDPPLTNDAPLGQLNVYLADFSDLANPSYRAITTPTPANSAPFTFVATPAFNGASADFTHIYFTENDVLTPGASAQLGPNGFPVDNIYEWVNGQLSLASVDPSRNPITVGAEVGANQDTFSDGTELHAVSSDGLKLFFTAGPCNSSNIGCTGGLYMRENGSTTVKASASQRTVADPNGPQPADFRAASADGSRVLFTSCEKLTNDSTAASQSPQSGCFQYGNSASAETPIPGASADLYSYNTSSGQLTDLTVDTADPGGADVQGVVGTSDDLSYMYFVAHGALAAGATVGQPNLYLLHGGVTHFIATLSASDVLPASSNFPRNGNGNGHKTARVTPDGTHLAFTSVESLTGYDNVDAATGNPDREVFLYNATANGGSGQLSCASCSPSGARPTGDALLPVTGDFGDSYRARALSDDGSRLFFETPDGLVPQDTNRVQDVYEYEDGQAHLISSGTGASATFMDASPSGNDVFFATRNQLVAQDTDDNLDVYDARVGGGIASQNQLPPPPCTADACRPPASGQPPNQSAGSATFSGPGNLIPAASAPAPRAKPKPPIRAQLLAKALKACHTKHNRQKRLACEKQARKRYSSKSSKSRK